MSNLIKNEITKIFKKKSIYIILFVTFAFVILSNCMYKYFYNNGNYSYYSESYIEYVREEIKGLDPNKTSDTKMYIEYKTVLDVYDMMKKYDNDAWQVQIIASRIEPYVTERNTYLYGAEKNDEQAEKINEQINELTKRLENDDWRYFANEELKSAEEKVKTLENEKSNTEDKQRLETLEKEIAIAKIDLEVAKYRVDEDIKYGYDHMNTALMNYQEQSYLIVQTEKSNTDLTYQEKKDYNDAIENKEISKYIIENHVDVEKANDLRGILTRFFNEFGLFIIVIIVMIAGTIVSEEFNKGTIKLLLIKPYNRNKILLSKFITVLIITIFAIIVILGMELIVGGIVFGFESLQTPVIVYNFDTNMIQEINIFTYVGTQVIMVLPSVILLATLSFALSTIFTNSPVAIALPLLGYMGVTVINQLAVQYNIEILKYFVTLNWDFTQYLYGGMPLMQGLTPIFSAIICIAYFLIMTIPTFIIFKKKNIKNI